jgi:hypothetical protein
METNMPQKTRTPDIIKTYIKAFNDHNVDAFASCFEEDAVVNDNGKEIIGLPAIKDWRRETDEKFNPSISVMDIMEQGNEVELAVNISGAFEKSPLAMRLRFTLSGKKFRLLRIMI